MQVNGEWSFSGQSHYSLSCSARLPPLPDSAFGRVDSSAQPNVQPISSNTDSDPHFERPPASSQDVRSSALWPASNLSADSSALTADQRLERLQIRKQMKSHCPPRSIRIISPYAHASPLGSTAHSFAPLSSSAASSSDSVKTNRLANTSQPLSQIDVSNDNPVQSVRTSISILPNAQRRSNRHSSSRSASGAPETEDEEFDDDQDDEKRPIRSLPITEHSINSFALSFQCTASPSPSSDSCSPGEPSLPIASTCTFTSPTSTSFASGVLYPMAAGSPSQSIGRHRPNEPSDGGGLLPPSSAIVTPTSHHHRAASSIHSSHADVPPSSASIAFDSQRVKSNSIDHQSRSLPSPPITLTSHSQTSSPLHTVYHLPASASNPIRSDRPFLSPGEPVVDRLHVIERDPNAANRPNEIVATSGVEADDEHEALDRARRVHRLPPNHLHQYHHSYHYQKRRPRLRSPHRPYSIVGSGAAIRPTSPYCARIDSESDHSSENDRDFSARSIGRSGTNSLHATSRTTICTIAQPEHRPIACQPESVHLNDKLDSELRFAGRLRKCTLQIKNCIFKSNAARHERSTNTAPNVDSALVTLKQQLDARPVHRYGAGLLVTLHVLLELLRDRIHRSRWCFIMSTDCVEDDPSSSACDTATAPRWRHRCRRVGQWMKKFVAHLFSTSGLCLLTVGYCIMGAAIFERLERQHNLNEIRSMTNYRNETVYHLWSLTKLSNVLKEDEWTMNASRFLEQFEKEIIKKVETAGYSGNVTDKWDFSDSLLYSITVVTTIG